MISLFANPGQTIKLAVEVKNSDGYRVDGYVPTVDYVYLPDGSVSSGFPVSMTNIDTGLYSTSILIPSSNSSVGTFIASVSWTHPTTGFTQYELFLINAALPFGNTTINPG